MKSHIAKTALIAVALLLSTIPSVAVEANPETAGATKAKASASSVKPERSATMAKIKLVDINSATKEELKKLPDISNAEAEKIIAGRPYLSKAHLQTHNIISPDVYQGLQKLVIAKQTQNVPVKSGTK